MNEKRGISLIVLIITIIVMIVLAATIIISLNNAGIINNANKAVENTNLKEVQTAAQLKYSEYVLNNSLKTDANQSVSSWIKSELVKDGILKSDEAPKWEITNKGDVLYYDEASYDSYAKAQGYVLADDIGKMDTSKSIRIKLGTQDLSKEFKLALPYGMPAILAGRFLEIVDNDTGTVLFDGLKISELLIPNTVISIGKIQDTVGMYDEGFPFKSIIIPESVTAFAIDALVNCTNLNTIYYNGVTLNTTVPNDAQVIR